MVRCAAVILLTSFMLWGCVAGGQRSIWYDSPNPTAQRLISSSVKGMDIREASSVLGLRLDIQHLNGSYHLVDSYNDIAMIPGQAKALINGNELSLPWAPFLHRGTLQIPTAFVEKLARSDVPIGAKHMPYDWYVRANRNWKYIIIHHSATPEGGAERFHKVHSKKWKHGLGYHFVIGNGTDTRVGEIEVGPRWKKQNSEIHGAHAGAEKYNKYGIGICLVGDFDKSQPSNQQLEAVTALIRHLQHAYRIPTAAILPHSKVRPEGTHCPGGVFPWSKLFEKIRKSSKSVHAMAR